jgi:predicted nucleic acid-binding protein
MTRYLLDSDAVVDYLKGFVSTVTFVRQLPSEGHQLCTCGVVECEVHTGLPPGQQEQGQSLLDALQYLPTSRRAARQAGVWRNAYRSHGVQLSATDCLIAATAREEGAEVVTANLRDFPMPELTVIPLPRAQARTT